MESFAWGNIVANAALLAVVAFFVKHWMNETEKTVKATASAISVLTMQHSKEIAAVTEKSREEVKLTARELSVDTKEMVHSIIARLEALTDQVRIANGRTSQNELLIKVQEARCQERSRSKRKEDCVEKGEA